MDGKRTKNVNVALCCGDTSWPVSRIIICSLIWEQVTKHDLSTLHVRNELNRITGTVLLFGASLDD
jgi:hypothetical protein